MARDNSLAWTIADRILTETGVALRSGNFEKFYKFQMLPQPIETFEGRRLITTKDQFSTVFSSVRAHFEELAITRLRRELTTARFVDDENIDAIYTTHLLAGSAHVKDPYPTYLMLRLSGDEWKVAYCMYAVPDSTSHSSALLNVPNEEMRPQGTIGHKRGAADTIASRN